jgi:pimeloyl-ACP methyl ester carboxylesterase
LGFEAPSLLIGHSLGGSAVLAAAKHPKSYVSLDDADHLISRKDDAIYAANVIAAWANKYIKGA